MTRTVGAFDNEQLVGLYLGRWSTILYSIKFKEDTYIIVGVNRKGKKCLIWSLG